MMHVRHVRVAVSEGLVMMRMRMAGSWSNRKSVGVLVMDVMDMHVGMIHGLMGMDMIVAFIQMHPDAPGHQCCRDQ